MPALGILWIYWIGVGFLIRFMLVALLGMASDPSYGVMRLLPS